MRNVSDSPELTRPQAELMMVAEMTGRYLERFGAQVTDLGFNLVEDVAEMVVQVPDGARLEFRVRRL